jgi:hypothetical protein
MKNHLFVLLIFVLAGVVILGLHSENASAHFNEQFQGIRKSASGQQSVETPIPTVTTSVAVIETPESRVLPPVGRNAGLVIGASVLVLIIIGGVLSSRWKQNH